jgi:hypothetical protein
MSTNLNEVSSSSSGVVLLLSLLAFVVAGSTKRELIRRPKNRPSLPRIPFWIRFHHYNDKEFLHRFRMSKEAFLVLLKRTHRRLAPKKHRIHWRDDGCGPNICPAIKLAMTLRYLAGGATVDIADVYGYTRCSVHQSVYEGIHVILTTPSIGRIQFRPADTEWMKAKGEMFMGNRSGNPFAQHCVGCIDGLAVEIERPPIHDGPKNYSNRKGFFAIVCQGICDAHHRFTFFSANAPGSTHDSVAFSFSDLFEILAKGLPEGYFVAADNAYPLVGSLIKPFAGRKLGVYEDSFNYYLSSLRVTIENAFGILVQRWGIL